MGMLPQTAITAFWLHHFSQPPVVTFSRTRAKFSPAIQRFWGDRQW